MYMYMYVINVQHEAFTAFTLAALMLCRLRAATTMYISAVLGPTFIV